MRSIVIASLSATFTSAALAGGGGWNHVATLSFGPSWSDAGQTQTFHLQPSVLQTYAATPNTEILGSGELFVGGQHAVAPHLHAQLGLAVAATTNTRLHGDIWQNADPDFNNLTYSYNVNHAHVAVKSKLITDRYSFVQPYISGSLGVGFNHSYQYNNTPKLFEVIAQPTFASHTNAAFTYTAGAGLQKALDNHLILGMGYEFADWGQSHLATAPGQTLNSGLHLSHLYTHQLQFSLSFST